MSLQSLKNRNKSYLKKHGNIPDRKFVWDNSIKLDYVIESKTYDKARYYHIIDPQTGEKVSFPSITTLFGTLPKDGLKKWAERIGQEEADRITREAGFRGTHLHEICENYLSNKDNYTENQPDVSITLFNQLKPYLHRISKVYHLEAPVFSRKLRIAGRCDCIADFDGVPSIIDFKTSRKTKEKGWIKTYFMQATFYSIAYQELTGVKIPQIVLLFAQDDGDVQYFVESRDNYIKDLVELVKNNHKLIYKEKYLLGQKTEEDIK